MQDNAPIHKVKKTMKWFRDQGIPVVEWSPYSPDMSPIEQIWFQLNSLVYEVNPDIDDLSGGEDKAREELGKSLKEAWERIPQNLMLLILSRTPERMSMPASFSLPSNGPQSEDIIPSGVIIAWYFIPWLS
ncbi:hypothetical protein AYL99_03085 [Fonsecaea erecta]|uniref:Tc1-like transposase DDE domain-containing protein n=1 Tax=Fonsecaea erecta TaxID=1367422 RepID=A0A178ZVP0_9EURO|nr:hypothetical protein AYL99_03085 [Fonsecaea erecta]OAP63858.1 hypothetical protein AYL99_03085 [Fonsecaea erecta]